MLAKIIIVKYGSIVFRNENGKLHRSDGPSIELSDGTKEWFINGKCHRLDGPAIEHCSGGKEWYLNGKLHRLDGPAVEYSDGKKQWWIEGMQYTEHAFTALTTIELE